MNRRTFIKYLSAAPIALAALLLSHKTSPVVRSKEKSEEFTPRKQLWCKLCLFQGQAHTLCFRVSQKSGNYR